MYKINFVPDNIMVEAEAGENLLEVARKAKVFVDAPCNGNRSCGKCLLKVVQGEAGTEKSRHLLQTEIDQGYILACASVVGGDLTLESVRPAGALLADMKTEALTGVRDQEIMLKAVRQVFRNNLSFGPGIRKDYLELEQPDLDDNISDWDRVKRYFRKNLGYGEVTGGPALLRKIPQVLRSGNFRVTVAHCPEKAPAGSKRASGSGKEGGSPGSPGRTQILNIEEGNTCSRFYGAAIDVGTTTVAAFLINLQDGGIIAGASAGNAQIKFGADVINRIIHATRREGLNDLKQAIVQETLNPLLNKMYAQALVDKDEVLSLAIAGNTTMMHLLLGVYPDFLRQEPYVPCFTSVPPLRGADLALAVNNEAVLNILPSVSSYVGGDITAGVLASGLWTSAENTLLMDLGTNGELVFGNRDYLLTCACSAGPAFEGGGLSCGMRATTGAIEKVAIDRQSLQPSITIINGGKPLGICGSGIIDAIAEMFLTGIIDSRGRINKNSGNQRIRFDEYGIGEYILASGEESQTEKDIVITEIDLENFIRAKGAVYSAIAVMLSSLGADFSQIDKIIVAGGIGSNINISNAVTIGLFPDIPREKYEYIGNSSLLGCYLALISEDAGAKLEELSSRMTCLELSAIPAYMDEFISACFLPHTNLEKFPSLKEAPWRYNAPK